MYKEVQDAERKEINKLRQDAEVILYPTGELLLIGPNNKRMKINNFL